MSYNSFMDPNISVSITYFDKIGVMESIYCEFFNVKKFELLEDKIDDELDKVIISDFKLVDDNIPAFFVSNGSSYLEKYVSNNSLVNFDPSADYKHYIFYGNTGGIAHIVTPKAPKLTEL